MKKILLSLLLLTAIMAGTKAAGSDRDEAVLRNIIIRNLRASQNENMSQYLDDIDEPLRAGTENAARFLFDRYDLSYKLVSFQLLSNDGQTAKVRVVQDTRKIRGPQFNDNRGTFIHTFKKRRNGWKLTDSQIISVERL